MYAPLILFLIFLLSRPYNGIVQDAHIYMGRALADLDPDGVGRDLMFVHDGQFGFSVFRLIAVAMIKLLGLGSAAKTLTILAAFAWFLGLFAFARAVATGASIWVAALFTILLPNTYGAPYPLGFAELIAVPRPFAEALVFAALAALVAKRDVVSLASIAAAALLHPIMAVAGFVVWASVRCLEDKRWIFAGAIGGVLLITAAMLGLPLAGRLFVAIDPLLRNLHEIRSPFLFPSLWPVESFPALVVQGTTLAIAAHLQHGRRRAMLASIIVTGLSGVAASAIFGDLLSSLLIVQAQLWRMAWLMAASAAMALGFVSVELWRRGLSERLVLAFLVLSWSFNTQAGLGVVAAILALFLHFRQSRFSPAIKPAHVLCAWIFTIVIATVWRVRLLAYLWHFSMAAPAGHGRFELLLIRGYFVLPICALAVYLALKKPRIPLAVQSSVAALLLIAAVALWDHRTRAQHIVEENHRLPDLVRLIAERPGEVYWMDSQVEAWFMLGRPQWASPLQGGPIIFSSELAREWQRRTQILIDAGLADKKSFSPWADPRLADRGHLTESGIRQLCTRPDAPAWVIAPFELGEELPTGLDMRIWPLPVPFYLLTKADDDYTWRKISALGLIPCAK
ncbi:MAG TPA: hypothetical protein VEK34_07865 [Methylocella sp.]|nr:hypothetical protein [Methylocella sp.]